MRIIVSINVEQRVAVPQFRMARLTLWYIGGLTVLHKKNAGQVIWCGRAILTTVTLSTNGTRISAKWVSNCQYKWTKSEILDDKYPSTPLGPTKPTSPLNPGLPRCPENDIRSLMMLYSTIGLTTQNYLVILAVRSSQALLEFLAVLYE